MAEQFPDTLSRVQALNEDARAVHLLSRVVQAAASWQGGGFELAPNRQAFGHVWARADRVTVR
jgi:hypothetical protein